MSDSELSDASSASKQPSHFQLESALQNQVRNALEEGDHAEVTVALMRRRAEETLGLQPGFYKKSEKWKEESKRIVHEAFNNHEAEPDLQSKPEQKSKPSLKPKYSVKPANSKKRTASSHDEGVVKRRRKAATAHPSPEEASPLPSELSDEKGSMASPATKSHQKDGHSAKAGKTVDPQAEASSGAESLAKDTPEAEMSLTTTEKVETSDSELSVLSDEEPKRKKQKKPPASSEKRGRKSAATATNAGTEVDPDQAEIKRLQSWLVKCGIRKLWGKELKPYDSCKAKIRHLKEMLAEAGMKGRYSLEKANQVKEERELKADIEAVQEGAQRWGKDPGAQDVDAAPKRKLVRGPPVLDFLSSAAEETD